MRVLSLFAHFCVYIFVSCWPYAAQASSYYIDVSDGRANRKYAIKTVSTSPSSLQCKGVLTHFKFTESGLVISFANNQFLRRGWSLEFLEERFIIAEKYKNHSKYIYVVEKQKPDEMVGSIGITWARQGNSKNEVLPMEESHGWRLPRFLNKSGESVVFEIRAYAMNEAAQSRELFTLLFSNLINSLNDFIGADKNLYDKEVIYTYGDETSHRMYRKLGFREVTELPSVTHLGNQWSVLAITPKQLIENYKLMLYNFHFFNDSNISMPVKGGIIELDGSRGVHVSNANETLSGVSAQEFSDGSGLIFSKGANTMYVKGKPFYIQSVKDDFVVSEDLLIPKGSSIQFNEEGKIQDVEHLGHEVTYLGMKIPNYSQIYFENSYPLPKLITILNLPWVAFDGHLFPGVEVKSAQLHIDRKDDLTIVSFFADENTKINGIAIVYKSTVQLSFQKGQNTLIKILPPKA